MKQTGISISLLLSSGGMYHEGKGGIFAVSTENEQQEYGKTADQYIAWEKHTDKKRCFCKSFPERRGKSGRSVGLEKGKLLFAE